MWRRLDRVASISLLSLIASAYGAPPPQFAPESTTDMLPGLLDARADSLELEIANLLSATSGAAARDPASQSAMIGLRVVLEQLLRTAARTDAKITPTARMLAFYDAMLIADTLPAFDQLVATVADQKAPGAGKVTGADASRLAAAVAGIQAFNKLTAGKLPDTDDQPSLQKFLATMLAPLAPLGDIEGGATPSPNYFPAAPAPEKAATQTEAALPTIDQTLQTIQQSSIAPALRNEMLNILPSLRDGMSLPDTAAGAKAYYTRLLHILSLATTISGNPFVDAATRTKLQEQCRVALVLLKDQRTQEMGGRRLESVEDIVDSVRSIQRESIDPESHNTIVTIVMAAVNQMTSPTTLDAGRHTLAALQSLLEKRKDMIAAEKQSVPSRMQDDFQKIVRDGNKVYSDVMAQLAATPDDPDSAIDGAAQQVTAVTENLNRFARMGDISRLAQTAGIHPAANVEIKLTLWAKAIGAAPEVGTGAANDFDHFAAAVTALNTTRSFVPATLTAEQTKSLTNDKYTIICEQLKDAQNKLAAALGSRTADPGPAESDLRDRMRLLTVTRDFLLISSADEPLGKLNGWALWHLSPETISLVRGMLQQAIAGQYTALTPTTNTDTGDTTDTLGETNILDYRAASTAVKRLALLVHTINPDLGPAQLPFNTMLQDILAAAPPRAWYNNVRSDLYSICTQLQAGTLLKASDHEADAAPHLRDGIRLLNGLSDPPGH
jgi:hypothetical protein